jgi:hypothetical protein
MNATRSVAVELAEDGRVEITQRGNLVDPKAFAGPIRLRLARPFLGDPRNAETENGSDIASRTRDDARSIGATATRTGLPGEGGEDDPLGRRRRERSKEEGPVRGKKNNAFVDVERIVVVTSSVMRKRKRNG